MVNELEVENACAQKVQINTSMAEHSAVYGQVVGKGAATLRVHSIDGDGVRFYSRSRRNARSWWGWERERTPGCSSMKAQELARVLPRAAPGDQVVDLPPSSSSKGGGGARESTGGESFVLLVEAVDGD
jgi:hypothetical protein